MGRVEGKVAIVTGAARGLGRAIGIALTREGAAVVFADLDGEEAAAAAEEVSRQGGRALGLAVDVADRKQVQAMIQKTVIEFGKLDVMFNNAGVNKPMNLLDVTEENWEFILRVNALGVLIGIQEAAKQMIAQGGGGKIVNTTSVAGRQGYPTEAPYCASKFAVVSLTQSAARGLAEHNITVNGFAPGVVDTPLWDQLDKDLMALGVSEKPGQAMANFSTGILRGKPATPDDIVGTTTYLASADSDYMTGQIIMIDGGMVLV